MNVNQIEHFIAIVEHGSYRAAAAHLGVTQPGLTKSVATLEADLGVTLLTRSRGKAASVTVFGRLIYERGLKLLEDLGQTRRSIELLRDGYAGDVRIGFGTTMALSTIAGISCALQAKLPNSMIRIRSGLRHELLPKLRGGQLDFLIVSGLSTASLSDLSAISLWRDPFMIFMRASHELSMHSTYDPGWAADFPWLSSERLVGASEKALHYLGHTVQSIAPSKFDVFDPAIIAEILRQGEYLSAWPSRSFEESVRAGTLRAMSIPPVDGARWMSETFLVRQRGVLMAPAVQSAWRTIQALDFRSDLSSAE